MTHRGNTNIHDDGQLSSSEEYLKRAGDARDAGDVVLSMYLYLAAFERSVAESGTLDPDVLAGLRQAWTLAVESKERSLAEYIFEKLEPYLSAEEIAACTNDLQGLVFDKLEEFGLSRDDLEEMSSALSSEFLSGESSFMSMPPLFGSAHTFMLTTSHTEDVPDQDEDEIVISDESEQSEDSEPNDAADDGQSDAQDTSDETKALSLKGSLEKDDAKSERLKDAVKAFASAAARIEEPESHLEIPSGYDDLVGFGKTVATMRDLGVGLSEDPEFNDLVKLLNRRHGFTQKPALDTILFCSKAREDANYFMAATVGELGLPSVRMHMEENMQGIPVLCVTAQANSPKRLSSLNETFHKGGVLVLEDVDLWSAPLSEVSDDMNGFFMMQMSRGAREAMNFVRLAVENPLVYVLASCSKETEIHGYFLDMLEPLSLIAIDLPTPEERVEIWMDIAKRHPSIRSVSPVDLVRLSGSMSRFEIYMAAREAMDEAYKQGLMSRRYIAVSRENIFDKLAAYQSLDSANYHELEDAILAEFSRDLEDLEDLLGE